MSGIQEFPQKLIQSSGSADVSYNKNTKLLSYYITWNGLAGEPSGAHIHCPAARGSNASVIHDFFSLIPATASGSFSNSVVVDGVTLKEADLLNGLYYFNFHNSSFPGGEIRGQIEF